jgi:hypothetical protein
MNQIMVVNTMQIHQVCGSEKIINQYVVIV